MYPYLPLDTSRQKLVLVWAIIGACSTTCMVGLRLVARLKHSGRLDKTDMCIAMAQVFYVALQIVAIIWVFLGGIGLHKADILARWGVEPLEIHRKCLWIYLLLGLPANSLARLTCLTALETFMPFREVLLATRMLAPVIVLGTVVFVFTTIFMCTPVELFWDLAITGGHCWDLQQYMFWLNLVDCLSDLMCLILPMPFIYRMQLPFKRKLLMVAMFSLAASSLAISLARQITLASIDMGDLPYSISLEITLMSLEGFVFLVLSSIPFLRPLFRSSPKHGLSNNNNNNNNNTPPPPPRRRSNITLNNGGGDTRWPFQHPSDLGTASPRRGSINTWAAYGRSFNDLGSSIDLEMQTTTTAESAATAQDSECQDSYSTGMVVVAREQCLQKQAEEGAAILQVTVRVAASSEASATSSSSSRQNECQ